MAGNTGFDQEKVNSMAQRHDELANDLQVKVKSTVDHVGQTTAGSKSQLTMALEEVAQNWQQNVDKIIVNGMNDMSSAMKETVGAQEEQDQASSTTVKSTPLDL